MFPPLLILANLESYLCWMEFNLTIIATPMQLDLGPMQMSSNSIWGGHGHSQIPTPEPKFRSQLLEGNTAGLIRIGQTSHCNQPEIEPPLAPYPQSSHMEELLNCCLIGKIWGDPLPLPAIIHKTKKDWFFVKG